MSKETAKIKIKNSLFQELYEAIKSRENKTFKFKIIEEKVNANLNIKFMSIKSQNEISNRFIRDLDRMNLKNSDICFQVSDVSFTLLDKIPYFHIKKFDIITNENISFYNFEQIKIYDSIDKIDRENNDLCFLILKAREIFKSLVDNSFIFEDITGKTINIEENDYNFEHGKIYVFKGYLYNNKNNLLEKTLISSIEEYSSYRDKVYELKELNKMQVGVLVNFKAKIITFKIKDSFLIIEDELGKKYKVNINFNLLKKISLSQECTFLNFIKIKNNEFNFTNLSNIESKEEETFVEFNFINYEDNKNRFYNNIKIDDKLYKIDKKTIKIKINESSKKNLFNKKIIFVRIEKEGMTDSLEYSYELNRGKTNHIEGFLGKGGFFYELYIKSIQKEDLPKQISIKIKDKILNFNSPDRFSNEFQERFILANVPQQNINTIFNSCDKIIDSKSGKYLILIKDKKYIKDIKKEKDKIIIKFIKEENYIIKKDFMINDNISNEMKKFYQHYIDNSNLITIFNNKNSKFLDLVIKNKKISSQIMQLLNIMFDGFNKYNFNNSKKEYDNIKYLSFIFICYYLYKAKEFGYIYISNFKLLLESIVKLDYIDRIKVLIEFIINLFENLFKEKFVIKNKKIKKKCIGPINDFFVLVNLEDDAIINKYRYIKTAFDKLYKIIDELYENCALFKIIQQINSLIYKNALNNKNIYSGSILNLNDIKLELIQNLNRYIIISTKDRKYLENYAFFRDISLTITINIKSILPDFLDNANCDLNNLSTVILFLIIHEALGHKKKNINNENIDTPREYYGTNFEELSLETSDSGLMLENIIFGKVFEPKYLINNKNPQILLNEKLYLEKNFENLHKLYSELENNLDLNDITEEEKEEYNEGIGIKLKSNKINKQLIETNSSDEDNEDYPILYHDLLAKYGNLNEKQKKQNKDNLEYQLFLLMYKDKKKKYNLENLE